LQVCESGGVVRTKVMQVKEGRSLRRVKKPR